MASTLLLQLRMAQYVASHSPDLWLQVADLTQENLQLKAFIAQLQNTNASLTSALAQWQTRWRMTADNTLKMWRLVQAMRAQMRMATMPIDDKGALWPMLNQSRLGQHVPCSAEVRV